MRLHQFVPLAGSKGHVCANCGRLSGLPTSALQAMPAALARCESVQSPRPPFWQRVLGPHNTFNCYVVDPSKVGVSSGTARIMRGPHA